MKFDCLEGCLQEIRLSEVECVRVFPAELFMAAQLSAEYLVIAVL